MTTYLIRAPSFNSNRYFTLKTKDNSVFIPLLETIMLDIEIFNS